MKRGKDDKATGKNPGDIKLSRARALATLFLVAIDNANDYMDALVAAFQCEDAPGAIDISDRLWRAWNDAYLCIVVLEEVSGCIEVVARSALRHSRQMGRTPLSLAWVLISRIPHVHHSKQRTIANAERQHGDACATCDRQRKRVGLFDEPAFIEESDYDARHRARIGRL